MSIGLCDIDSRNFLNLCLIKLSTSHRVQGDYAVALLNRVRTKVVHFAGDIPDIGRNFYFRRFLELSNTKSSRKRQVNNKRISHSVYNFAGCIPNKQGDVCYA